MELARRAGVCVVSITNVINLRRRPGKELADSIQRAFGEIGLYVDVLAEWPESFRGLGRGGKLCMEHTAEVPTERLIGCAAAGLLEASAVAPDVACEIEDRRRVVEEVIETIGEQNAQVLRLMYWEGKDLADTGSAMGLTKERIRQIEAKALRMLRHPTRIRVLDEVTAGLWPHDDVSPWPAGAIGDIAVGNACEYKAAPSDKVAMVDYSGVHYGNVIWADSSTCLVQWDNGTRANCDRSRLAVMAVLRDDGMVRRHAAGHSYNSSKVSCGFKTGDVVYIRSDKWVGGYAVPVGQHGDVVAIGGTGSEQHPVLVRWFRDRPPMAHCVEELCENREESGHGVIEKEARKKIVNPRVGRLDYDHMRVAPDDRVVFVDGLGRRTEGNVTNLRRPRRGRFYSECYVLVAPGRGEWVPEPLVDVLVMVRRDLPPEWADDEVERYKAGDAVRFKEVMWRVNLNLRGYRILVGAEGRVESVGKTGSSCYPIAVRWSEFNPPMAHRSDELEKPV